MSKKLDPVAKYHVLKPTRPGSSVSRASGKPLKVVGSIPVVVRHVFPTF